MSAGPSTTHRVMEERGSFGLVVPLFNEEERFPEYGKRFVDFVLDHPAGSEVVFVDDGSEDATAELVEELLAASPGVAARLVRLPHQGKGAAVAAGIGLVQTRYVGFCDLDLSTPLDQVERVLEVARRAPVLAIGSRDLTASRLVEPEGPVREALGRAYNRLVQATVAPGVVDTQCGAKVALRSVWERLLPRCREVGYAWDAEVIAVARSLGIVVEEVPVAWRHDARSKVRVGRDGLAMVWATQRIWRNVRRTRVTDERRRPHEVFDAANAELLMGADSDHWWFRSKAALVATALRRTDVEGGSRGWLVDAGAGAGGVTAMLGWDPTRVAVVEGNAALVDQAHRRHGLAGIQATVDRLPLADGSADVVCLLDVIEHLAVPVAALREARRVLSPHGRVVINVPAHRWLWSAADEVLGHHRRYTRGDLRQELVAAGLRPVLSSHAFSWLVPPVWLKRRLSKGGAELGLDQSSALLDRAAMVLTAVERSLIGRAVLPFGTSVLCVCVASGEPHHGASVAPERPQNSARASAGSTGMRNR
jgi:dolichyl-phosphate beta-glucosyltransferase